MCVCMLVWQIGGGDKNSCMHCFTLTHAIRIIAFFIFIASAARARHLIPLLEASTHNGKHAKRYEGKGEKTVANALRDTQQI